MHRRRRQRLPLWCELPWNDYQTLKWKCVNFARDGKRVFAEININLFYPCRVDFSCKSVPSSRMRKEKGMIIIHFWRIATHAACRSSLSLGVRCRRSGASRNRPNGVRRCEGDGESEYDTSACGMWMRFNKWFTMSKPAAPETNGGRQANSHTDDALWALWFINLSQ